MQDSNKPYGFVLYAWFPEHLHPNQLGSKYRPVLVVDYNAKTQQVQLAYGTSQRTHAVGYGEFVVNCDDVNGLTKDTKFCLGHTRWVPVNDCFFAKDGKRHNLGKLPKRYDPFLLNAINEVLFNN
jgi:hypothetical protein